MGQENYLKVPQGFQRTRRQAINYWEQENKSEENKAGKARTKSCVSDILGNREHQNPKGRAIEHKEKIVGNKGTRTQQGQSHWVYKLNNLPLHWGFTPLHLPSEHVMVLTPLSSKP